MRRTAIIHSKQPPEVERTDRAARSDSDRPSAERAQSEPPGTIEAAALALQRAVGNAVAARFIAQRERAARAVIQREVKQVPSTGKWYSTLDFPPKFFDTRPDAEARDRELERQRPPQTGSQPRPMPPQVGSSPQPEPKPPRFVPPPGFGSSPLPQLKPPPPFGQSRTAPSELPSQPRPEQQTRPVVPHRPARRLPDTSSPEVQDVERRSKPPNRPPPAIPVRAQPQTAPQFVPQRSDAPPPGPVWRDIPRDVQQALQEAYAAHQSTPFTSDDELYEKWYKQSARKGTTQPRPQQVRAYETQVQHHLPKLGPPARGEAYRYLDQGDELPAFRIYVNPVPEHAAEVVANVAKLARQIPGYVGSKIGDASVAYTGRDVFVIYLNDKLGSDGEAVRKEALRALGGYHEHNQEMFVDEVPRLTRPVLKGVSIGAEPPGANQLTTALIEKPLATGPTAPGGESEEHHLDGSRTDPTRFSFSTYRAQLIFEALKSTRDEESYRRRILENFAIGGIDASAPYLQGKLPSTRILYRLGMVYQTIRLTGVTLAEPHRPAGTSVQYKGHTWSVDMVSGYGESARYVISRAEPVPEPGA